MIKAFANGFAIKGGIRFGIVVYRPYAFYLYV